LNKTLKYLIVPTPRGPRAILFSEHICHCEAFIDPEQVISAGFVTISSEGDVLDVYGEAISFNTTVIKKPIKSTPLDACLINMTLKAGPWDYGLSPDDLKDIPELATVFEEKEMQRCELTPPFEIETCSASLIGEELYNTAQYVFCMMTGFPVKIDKIGYEYQHPLWDAVYVYQGNNTWTRKR